MVIGGGDSAMEEANFLTRFGREVTPGPPPRGVPRLQDHARPRAANPKIKLLTNTVVEDVYDVEKSLVTGVRLRNLRPARSGTRKWTASAIRSLAK